MEQYRLEVASKEGFRLHHNPLRWLPWGTWDTWLVGPLEELENARREMAPSNIRTRISPADSERLPRYWEGAP